MVLGMNTNNRRSAILQADYIIHVKEIKPWPPSQSLNSLRSVMIQWENGSQSSGSTNSVAPSLGEGRIEFNHSFNLSVALPRVMSIRSSSYKAFQKNCLEFNLYEPRRDKLKGQLLGTAVIDLVEFGILKESLSVSALLNCKRNFRNISQPVLFINIQPVINRLKNSSSRNSLAREMSMDRRSGESVLALMNEEYAEEAALLSAVTVAPAAYETNEDLVYPTEESSLESAKDCASVGFSGPPTTQITEVEKSNMVQVVRFPNVNGGKAFSSCLSVFEISSSAVSPIKVDTCFSNLSETTSRPASTVEDVVINALQSSAAYKFLKEDFTDSENGNENLVENRDLSGEDEKHIQEKDVDNEEKSDFTTQVEEHSSNEECLEMDMGTGNRLKQVKSVCSFSKKDVADSDIAHEEAKEAAVCKGTRTLLMGQKLLEQRIKTLEGELRDAAAIEVALYAVVAEHGSSSNKVHAPARRLSRLYLHACNDKSHASAAKTSVSGLVLVTKACGNDVPRLTYWLSNCIVLRTIISLATGLDVESDDVRSSSLNCEEMKHMKDDDLINASDWGDPQTYACALEKVEGWIFFRIVQSLWWQTLVPYMQCYEESFNNRISVNWRRADSDDQELCNFSVELWKEAFKEASERLCPVRAERHACGCLPVLSRLIMEQCVARLDVAMFNAIFRESADEVPTDPVSDPIGDPRVLPVLVGKSSFGAGAQLKNAIGNWSTRLKELFGFDDDGQDASTKYFYLLHTLSELMMLPKDMLLNNSIKKEVCPTFGAPLIKMLLQFHVPDEFCPDLVPEAVLEALNCEETLVDFFYKLKAVCTHSLLYSSSLSTITDSNEFGEECISHVPFMASPPVYRPPSVDSLASIIGKCGNRELRNSGSSLLRKSYTSDDELEELCSPLSLIFMDGIGSSGTLVQRPKEEASTLRYQLLRDVWQNRP